MRGCPDQTAIEGWGSYGAASDRRWLAPLLETLVRAEPNTIALMAVDERSFHTLKMCAQRPRRLLSTSLDSGHGKAKY